MGLVCVFVIIAMSMGGAVCDSCDDFDRTYDQCNPVKYHLCENVEKNEWVGHASTEGVTGDQTHKQDSKQRAYEHATEKLFNMLPNNVTKCNCYDRLDYVVDGCAMDIQECYRVCLEPVSLDCTDTLLLLG